MIYDVFEIVTLLDLPLYISMRRYLMTWQEYSEYSCNYVGSYRYYTDIYYVGYARYYY